MKSVLIVVILSLSAALAVALAALAMEPRTQHLKPLSEVKLGEETDPEARLGKAVGSVDFGGGVPCAVYRNGPVDRIVRKQTTVFWCATP